jgi:hypothetical protein
MYTSAFLIFVHKLCTYVEPKLIHKIDPRKKFSESLVAAEMWHSASFKTYFLERYFADETDEVDKADRVDEADKADRADKTDLPTPALWLPCQRPFFFSLRNNRSDVFHLFGLVRDHPSFNSSDF